MSFLDGLNIAPRTVSSARKLIGKNVVYLTVNDIDRSGRGYFFPKRGKVQEAIGRNISIEGDWITIKSIVEMVEG